MSEDLVNDRQFQKYAYVTKQDLASFYTGYDKKLYNEVCGTQKAEQQSSDDDDDKNNLLFVI